MSRLIAIGGVSRSGKTILALWLNQHLPNSQILHQDDYTLPETQIPKIKNRTDWEHPASINWLSWRKDIIDALGQSDFVIIEGLFAFHDKELNSYIDFPIFLTLDQTVFSTRRLEETRWGKEPDWYIQHVWKAYQKYGLPPTSMNAMEVKALTENDYQSVLEKVLRNNNQA